MDNNLNPVPAGKPGTRRRPWAVLGAEIFAICLFAALIFHNGKTAGQTAGNASGIVFRVSPGLTIPAKLDTLRAFLLVTDTTTGGNAKFYNGAAFQIRGFIIIGGPVWTPSYLNQYRKPIARSLLVWDCMPY